MGSEITLRDLYDQQVATLAQLGALRTDLAAHQAQVTERLASGSRTMRDHEDRLRAVEAALPDDVAGQLSALRAESDRRRGGLGVLGTLGAVIGSDAGAALLTWLITRH